MTVQNMVCPDCASTHGREHAPGCPRGFALSGMEGDYVVGYQAGWDAAKTLYGGLARDERAATTQRTVETLRSMADALERTSLSQAVHSRARKPA